MAQVLKPESVRELVLVLELALEEMGRLFPDKDPVSMLRTNRGMLNSVQNLGSLSRADHLMGGVGRGGVDYW